MRTVGITWARAKYNENRFEEAIQAFQKCLKLRPRYALAADGLGLSYEGLNRIADAISWLENAISWQEDGERKSPEPYTDLGDLLSQQARFDEALPFCKKPSQPIRGTFARMKNSERFS